MSTKSIYVTLRYDPRKSGPTDELAALVDAAALGLPPPLSGPGPEHLNAHSVRFLWIPPPPAQEARRMYDEWGGIWAAADPAQTIRAQVVGVAARQRTDEKQRKVMKERGMYVWAHAAARNVTDDVLVYSIRIEWLYVLAALLGCELC